MSTSSPIQQVCASPAVEEQTNVPKHEFASIPDALEAIRRGEIVIVMDDEDRENEGDLIMAAEFATEDKMAFFVNYTTGILCAPMSAARASELRLPIMVHDPSDPNKTAFTVSTDSIEAGTGVSATDRALTFTQLADSEYKHAQFRKPGHIFPLIARPGGVRERRGHTEASFDLCRLAGVKPVGVIGELVNKNGSMKRLDDCFIFAEKYDLKVITIEQLLAYRIATESDLTSASPVTHAGGVELVAQCELPIFLRGRDLGPWTLKCFHSHFDGRHHIALERGDITREPYDPVLLRVHSECFTGDILGSRRCDCGEQLYQSLVMIMTRGRGVLIYNVGHEGRGIGLANKILAYHLQQKHGMDTYAANHKLGFEDDLRDYSTAKAIIGALGIKKVQLITSNTTKAAALGALVDTTVPLEGTANPHNRSYLDAKRKKHSSTVVVQAPVVEKAVAKEEDANADEPFMDNDNEAGNVTHASFPVSEDTAMINIKSVPINLPAPRFLDKMRIGLAYTSWNEGYVGPFAAGIKQSLLEAGVLNGNILECQVPGSFDVIVPARALAMVYKCDVVICIGVLLKGETTHFENVSNAVIQGMVQIMTNTGVPVINGVLNCMTEGQAKRRCGFNSPLRGSLAASALHMGTFKIETDMKIAAQHQQ